MPGGALLVIDFDLDLGPFRLKRGSAHAHSLEDQLDVIEARGNGAHPGDGLDTLRCAQELLDPSFDVDHRVRWRPVVDLASSARRVRIEPDRASRLETLAHDTGRGEMDEASRDSGPIVVVQIAVVGSDACLSTAAMVGSGTPAASAATP